MSYSLEDSHMTPNERRCEIARILAKAILRLNSMAHRTPVSVQSEPSSEGNSPQKRVDVSATSRPHGTRG